MRPGIYTVESWNGKDGVLIRDDGEFLGLTKADLPKTFEGILFRGEKVEVKVVTVIDPMGGRTRDERARSARTIEVQGQQASQKHRDFIAAENERRMRYGVKPIC